MHNLRRKIAGWGRSQALGTRLLGERVASCWMKSSNGGSSLYLGFLLHSTVFLPFLLEAVTAHFTSAATKSPLWIVVAAPALLRVSQGTAGVKSLLEAWIRRDALRILSYHTSQNATEEKFCA